VAVERGGDSYPCLQASVKQSGSKPGPPFCSRLALPTL